MHVFGKLKVKVFEFLITHLFTIYLFTYLFTMLLDSYTLPPLTIQIIILKSLKFAEVKSYNINRQIEKIYLREERALYKRIGIWSKNNLFTNGSIQSLSGK